MCFLLQRSTEEIGKLEAKLNEMRLQLKESMAYKTKTQQLFDEVQFVYEIRNLLN